MRLLVAGGAGFIGSAFVQRRLASTSRFDRRRRQADVRGEPGEPGGRPRPPSPTRDRVELVVADIADRDLMAELAAAPTPSSTSRPSRTSTARSRARRVPAHGRAGRALLAGGSSTPARSTPAWPGTSASSRSRPTRSTGPCPRAQRRGRRPPPVEPIQRRQGGRRAPRRRVSPDLRTRHGRHPGREHLRARSVPREAHPASSSPMPCRTPAADVRRRPAEAIVAPRR